MISNYTVMPFFKQSCHLRPQKMVPFEDIEGKKKKCLLLFQEMISNFPSSHILTEYALLKIFIYAVSMYFLFLKHSMIRYLGSYNGFCN